MPAFQAICPGCKMNHTFIETLYGKKAKCKNCQKYFYAGQPERGMIDEAPTPSAAARTKASATAQQDSGPHGKRRAADDSPVREASRRPRSRWEGDDSRPAGRGRRGNRNTGWVIGLVIGVSLLVLLPLLIGGGVLAMYFLGRTPGAPQQLPIQVPAVVADALPPAVQPPPPPLPVAPVPPPPDVKEEPAPEPPPPPEVQVEQTAPGMERVLILIGGPLMSREIDQLTFRGPPGNPTALTREITNVQPLDGFAPPAGTYYNHQFTMTMVGTRLQTGGVGVTTHGPYCSHRVPANTRLLNVRRLGLCTLDLRYGRMVHRQVTMAVHEGFYERR